MPADSAAEAMPIERRVRVLVGVLWTFVMMRFLPRFASV
jgi:hypothetical protein